MLVLVRLPVKLSLQVTTETTPLVEYSYSRSPVSAPPGGLMDLLPRSAPLLDCMQCNSSYDFCSERRQKHQDVKSCSALTGRRRRREGKTKNGYLPRRGKGLLPYPAVGSASYFGLLSCVPHPQFFPADRTILAASPLKIFDAAKAQGRFLYACAPMVRYSKV